MVDIDGVRFVSAEESFVEIISSSYVRNVSTFAGDFSLIIIRAVLMTQGAVSLFPSYYSGWS